MPSLADLVGDPRWIIAILCLNVVLAEWLVRTTACRHLGTTLLVIVTTAVIANLGIIPTSASETPVYGGVFDYVAPLSIFWLLLRVNLRDILKAGGPMLLLFLAGSLGTALGVIAATWLLSGETALGSSYRAIGGIFVGTYTGGAVNFNALALHYQVNEDGPVFAGLVAVDNLLTTVWMVATIALPRLLARFWPRGADGPRREDLGDVILGIADDTESVHPLDVGLLLTLGFLGLWLSHFTAAWCKEALGWDFPSVIVLTTLALILAQFRAVKQVPGSRMLGMFAMYVFLAVIGAQCDVMAFDEIGQLGLTLLLFATLVVAIHGLVVFLLAALFRQDVDLAAVASQANIGGATTALGLARTLGRGDLVLPAILAGSLGYAVGTYLGWLVAEWIL